MSKVKKILVVAITRLGDMLQASPTIVGLKEQHPGAELTVAIEKSFASICKGIPGIDDVFEIDLNYVCQCLAREREGLVDAYRYLDNAVEELRRRDYDFVLNMSSSGYTALLLRMLNVRDMRGWVSDEEGNRLILDPWAMLFSAFVYHSNRDYNSINLVDIFRCAAGVTKHPRTLMYNVPPETNDFVDTFLAENGIDGDGPLIAIQVGASQGKRQWSPPRFAHLARLLIEKLNARLVFTGSGSEEPIVSSVFKIYNHPRMVSAVGKTDLSQLGAILKRCETLVTGDTGTMHLSVAVGTPVVALFLASALCFETGPYSSGNIVLQPQITCNPCNPNLPCSRPDCHEQISPELLCELVKLRTEKSNSELLEMELSREKADPAQVAVFVTTFDEDGFCRFQQVNGSSARNGFSDRYFDAARESYRSLWKSEFASVPIREAIDRWSTESSPEALQVSGSVRSVIELTHEAQRLLDQLCHLIQDDKSPPYLLGATSEAISTVERSIEDLGLSNAILGAAIRMFIMEKENLRGDDPLFLALETKRIYDTLSRRCDLFNKLYRFHSQEPQGSYS